MDDLLPHVLSVLSTTPERWRALAGTVQPDLLSRPPAPGEWSALDCLRHLLATERDVFPVRVAAIMAGRDFEAFDPDAAGATSEPGGSRGGGGPVRDAARTEPAGRDGADAGGSRADGAARRAGTP